MSGGVGGGGGGTVVEEVQQVEAGPGGRDLIEIENAVGNPHGFREEVRLQDAENSQDPQECQVRKCLLSDEELRIKGQERDEINDGIRGQRPIDPAAKQKARSLGLRDRTRITQTGVCQCVSESRMGGGGGAPPGQKGLRWNTNHRRRLVGAARNKNSTPAPRWVCVSMALRDNAQTSDVVDEENR